MGRARIANGFTALKVEGGILSPEFVQSIAALKAPYQSDADYGLSKSLAIKEELARYWRIASDLYSCYAEHRPREDLQASKVCIDEWLVPLLRSPLGYEDLSNFSSPSLNEEAHSFNPSHRAFDGAVPVLLTTHDADLDKVDHRFGYDGRRQAAHGAVQEYLNAKDSSLWGIVSNGSKLRLLRNNVSLTRPSYIEADLDLIFEEELYPDFAALWLTTHATRLKPVDENPSNCIIEQWRTKAHETGERVRENLRMGVTETLRRLGNGFLCHRANNSLRDSFNRGVFSPEAYFEQLLRLVYRMLFLFTAEERGLLHAPETSNDERVVYREGYSLSRLRDRALRRRHYDRKGDLWQGLKITFAALRTNTSGLGLPALGGLFDSEQCIDIDQCEISNEDLLEAIRTLAFFPSGTALARVNYRDMDTEELGSIYESLLELRPVIDVDAHPWIFSFVGDVDGEKTPLGSERKLTGSYYTPPNLVGELIKSTLDPVIAQSLSSQPEDPRKAILDLKVIDPACGSGHFLLAAARRLASELARIESGLDTPDEATRQHALREVVQHCIHGVDRNPLAIELCKASLWIETVEPGKPLSFLDSHIVLGDSLVGVHNREIIEKGIPREAYDVLTGDDKEVCTNLKRINRQPGQQELFDSDSTLKVALTHLDIDAMSENSLDDLKLKRSAWLESKSDPAYIDERMKADLFVGAFFAPKTKSTLDLVPRSQDLVRLDASMEPRKGVERFVQELAHRHRFHHWYIEFAQIMEDGGFDVVLGNPPWEVFQLNEQEFFANFAPSIANAAGAARKNAIAQLEINDPGLWEKYQVTSRNFEARNKYCRSCGRYGLSAFKKLNSYVLFADVFLQLLNSRGRAGLIVPSGIATDDSTKKFFGHIVAKKRLVSLFDFENREAVFSGVHRSYKFCLLTLTGQDNSTSEAEFAFFLHQTEQLKDAERRFKLSTDDFLLFNPNTRTCPIFRSRRDMEIARKMYQRAGILWREGDHGQTDENPWGISFMQMFNMTSDSGLFRTRTQLEDDGWELYGNVFVRGKERYLPLYEAKLFHQYDHRFATFEGVSEKDRKGGNARAMSVEEKADSQSVVIPRYWVEEKEVEKRFDNRKIDAQLFTEQNRTEQNRTEQNRTEQNRTEQNRTEQNRTPLYALTKLARNSLSGMSFEQPTNGLESRR